MRTVHLTKADQPLSSLVDQALSGEDVVVFREGRPLVRLVPVEAVGKAVPARRFGQLAGRVHIGPDFDDPLPEEFMRAFRGEDP